MKKITEREKLPLVFLLLFFPHIFCSGYLCTKEKVKKPELKICGKNNREGKTDVQCVAVCCSVLQCAAVCFSVLQCVAVCCSVLQCVAVCCNGNDSLAAYIVRLCRSLLQIVTSLLQKRPTQMGFLSI